MRAWSTDYAANMATASSRRQALQATHLAKRNADFWLWHSGLGGIGSILAPLHIPHPLSRFYGAELKAAVLGPARGLKRSSPASSPARRVRPRSSSPDREVPRAQPAPDLPPLLDDADIEAGRNAPSPPRDPSADTPAPLMPWHPSTGSQRTGPRSRRRTVSASPLVGRPRPTSSPGLPDLPDLDLALDSSRLGAGDEVTVQSGADSSEGTRSALEREAGQFLAFVRARLDGGVGEVAFGTLLPPGECSVVVAAQGLLHVLALGTEGALGVRQEGAEGEVWLSLGAAA